MFFASTPRLPRLFFFFFNDTATTEIYTLSLHDALPICTGRHSLDSGTNQRHGRTNRSAARRHRAPEFGHSGTQRSPAATRPVGRRVPAQGRGSRFRDRKSVV